MMTHQYEIEGITCNGCVTKVRSELLKLPDVLTAQINLETKEAEVKMAKHISLEELQSAVSHAGDKYKITEKKNGLHVNGRSTITSADTEQEKTWLTTYKPLLLIFAFITGVSLLTSFQAGVLNIMRAMNSFMAGFFLVFSFFKFLDLKSFAESYAMYDALAKQIKVYGYIYPFIELLLGIFYLLHFNPFITNITTITVMGFSSIGVIQSVWKKQKIQCACLGTVFNLPMSTVTIVEDLLMVIMAAAMLVAH
jgi:cation transport ATPase